MLFLLVFIIILSGIFLCQLHRYHHVDIMAKPSENTVQQIVYRIPLEDRTDMDIEDRHNVHNMCLKRNAFNVVQDLRVSDQQQFTIDSALEAIHRLIEYSIDTDLDKLDNAEMVLLSIEDIGATYTSCHIKETELIRLIWERIHHPMNKSVQEQQENNLIEQLADCKNGTHGLHCCEGRIMRLLQTLEGCDSQGIVNLRPMWAFKEEIANKIMYYRSKLLEKAPLQYTLLDQKIKLNQKEEALFNAFNQCLIRNLNKRFEIDYVSQGLLSPIELEDITKPYYENL